MPVNDLYIYASVCFILVFAAFLCCFRTSYYENTNLQILFCLLFSAFVGAGAVTLVLGFMDFMRGTFYPEKPKLNVILCGAVGGAASRLLNIILRRANGLTLMNIKDIAEMREQMSSAERMIHAVECPFHKEHALLHARSYTTEIPAEVERILSTQEVGYETSGELSGCRFRHGPMGRLSKDRIAPERESAVDNRTENSQ